MQDSQATLQGIKISQNGHIKLEYPQYQTQDEKYHLQEKQEVDMNLEALGVHIRRKYEKVDESIHTL